MRTSIYFYQQYYTLSELLGDNMNEIIKKAITIYQGLDGITETTKLETMMNIVFDELITNPSETLVSRYKKYDHEGNLIPLTKYNPSIANKLYQCFLPLWQQKQFFNASMDWNKLSDLLTERRNNKIRNLTKGRNVNTQHSDTGNYVNGEEHGLFKNSPEYASDGSVGDVNNQGSFVNEGSVLNNSENVAIKLDYLKQLNELIEKQRYAMTDTLAEFINSISYPNQHIEFNMFPWPWRFDGDFH